MYEVDLDSQVIHLKSLGMPSSSKKGTNTAAVADSTVTSTEKNTEIGADGTTADPAPESSEVAVVESASVCYDVHVSDWYVALPFLGVSCEAY